MSSKPFPAAKPCTRQPIDERVQKILNDRFPIAVLYVTGLSVMLLMELQKQPQAPGWYSYCTAFFIAIALLQFHRVRRQVLEIKLGRDGERAVAEQLDMLKRQGVRVLHDIPGDNFTLNNVVVCAKGIFVIETRAPARPQAKAKAKIVFDGEKLQAQGHSLEDDPLERSSVHVAWLSRLLKHSTGQEFPVRGVLAFPGWWTETTVTARNSRLSVLEPEALSRWLLGEPQRLKEYEVAMAGFHLEEYARVGA